MRSTAPFPRRTFGALLHPTSLPGPEPVGTLGPPAYEWVDWLASTGAGIWQILPLTYTGDGDSPYFSPSAFAGNPWLVDLGALVDAGLLDPFDTPAGARGERVDFEAMRAWKQPLLDRAAAAFVADRSHAWSAEYARFAASADWLTDACHFIARKRADPETAWWDWPAPLRRREPAAVAASSAEHADAIERERVLQFFVERQWSALRAYAADRGVQILGDVPIYVAPDSVDVWVHQDLFELDGDGRLVVQAGVPPDYFSATGQLWGNPIYRWDAHAAEGHAWWIARLRRALDQADIVRIDHFRALSAYWSVPADHTTAIDGEWVTGPGQTFVDAVRAAFPELPIVAEDLGDLDDAVLDLRDRNGLVGMRVLQFGLDSDPPNEHHPAELVERCVVYTGTHDNDTLAAWWDGLTRRQRARARSASDMPPRIRTRRAVWWLIDVALRSPAVAAVVPVQDLLVLGGDARMNVPGTTAGNWEWRLRAGALDGGLAERLRTLAVSARRT